MKITKYLISILTLFFVFQLVWSQQPLPIIHATSVNVKILDGLNYKTDYWVIFPETKPDIYYTDLPRKNNQLVKFITNVDSISFIMNYGETKDFIILLNGKDSCYTRISANYPQIGKPLSPHNGNDTIPFSIKNNRIYFKGTINDSGPLNMQFDLGAGAVNVNAKSVKKININFDKTGNLVNSQGTNTTRVSSLNQVKIGDIIWRGVEIYETNNMDNYEDVIIGNSFFLDQIYKIDYDNNEIIIYKTAPKPENGFIQQNMLLDNGLRPLFEASLVLGDSTYSDWFLFDTGNTSNGILGSAFLERNNLYKQFSIIVGFGGRKIVRIPKLIIAQQTFTRGAITLEKPNKEKSQYKYGGIIGNKMLMHFNVIIDNREGFIYLQPRGMDD